MILLTERQLFKELLSRYHYLVYAMPYGARLQYLVHVSRPRREVVGCVQFFEPGLADEGSRSMDRLG
ncbi:MAG: Druantia anti-phage system protein DruA [Desulfobacterales bacterium]